MKHYHHLTMAMAIMVLFAACVPDDVVPPPPPPTYSAKVANDWMSFETDKLRALGVFPAPAVRYIAYSSLALYESILPEYPQFRSMYAYLSGRNFTVPSGRPFYAPASANAAIAQLLRKFTTDAGFLKAIDSMEIAQAAFLDQSVSSITRDSSILYGRMVADTIYQWSRTDGTFNTWPAYTVPTGPGLWEPTPPAFVAPTGVYQGELRSFMRDVSTSFPPATPPAFSTDTASSFYKMADRVVQSCKNLTRADTLMVNTWRDITGINYNIPSHMTKLLSGLLAARGISLHNAAVVYARNGIAINDAIISCFKSKYKHNLMRPVTYIRKHMNLPTWNSVYPAPPHPAYPAIAPTGAAAAVVGMEAAMGVSFSFTDRSQEALYGARSYGSFSEMLVEIGRSRTVGGINYQESVDAGLIQGRKIGEMALRLPFNK
jgi:hypothetical protein